MGEFRSRVYRVFVLSSFLAPCAPGDTKHLVSEAGLRSNAAIDATHEMALQGDIRTEAGAYSEAIGRMAGCTGTLISAPGTPAVVLRASHCGGGTIFQSRTRRIGGFECYTNRDWARSQSSEDDVQVCVSGEPTPPGFIGCPKSASTSPLRVNEELMIFGHGNPMWDRPMVSALLRGVTRIRQITRGLAMFAVGAATVTKGDSGGPVARAADYAAALTRGFFEIVGVNSVRAGSASGFAPISPASMDFFNRAIARVRADKGLSLQLCGVNWSPGAATPGAIPVPTQPSPAIPRSVPTFAPPRGIFPPPSPRGSEPERGERISDHLQRIDGFVHERIAAPDGGFRFEKLLGSATGEPYGRHGRMSEDAQKGLLKLYCQAGFAGYEGQRLTFALAFVSRRRNEVDAACMDRVVRPALARAPAGNALVDALRSSVGPSTPPRVFTPTAPSDPAPLPPGALPPPPGVWPSPTEAPRPELPPGTRAQYEADIRRYEHEMRYIDGSPREKYPTEMFRDVPAGGTGKLILAYFGNSDDPTLHAMAARNPLVEVRRYALGSPEHRHAQLFRVQALGVDGLGRKITRYAMSPHEALRSLMDGEEARLLDRYLKARAALGRPGGSDPVPPPPVFTRIPTAVPSPGAPPSASAVASFQDAMGSRCISCHGKTAPAFPDFVRDWGRWESLLAAGDPTAKHWLEKFQSKVVHGNMLTLSGLSPDHGAGKDIVGLLSSAHSRFRADSGPRGHAGELGSPGAAVMIDPAKKAEYFAVLRGANIADPEVRKALLEFDGIWDSEGSPAWSWAPRDGDSGRKGQRPVGIEPAGPVKPHLFQNIDGKWAWKEPFSKGYSQDAGTKGLKSFFLIRFPRDSAGNLIKGVRGTETHQSIRSDSSSGGYATTPREGTPDIWASFPDGTRVIEVLYSTDLGEPVLVDVLSREKRILPGAQGAQWVPDAHRVDASPEKIRRWVETQPDAATNPDLRKILSAVGSATADSVRSDLGADGSGGTPFVVDGRRTNTIPGSKSVLPPGVGRETLLRMYREMPLTSAAGSPGWQLEVQDAFRGSHRGIRVDTKTCANCHASAGESFRDVFTQAGLATNSVSAYGNVGGYDGVLSAPWFNQEALNEYGRRVRMDMRPEWARFFEDYDPARHSPSRYLRTAPWGYGDRPLMRGR